MLKKIDVKDVTLNPFVKIGREPLLVTAGILEKYNTMAAGWGGLGVLWGRNAATVYINPARYTFEFANESDCFTLCFFGPEYRDKVMYCGSVSGREVDKTEKCGFTPVASESGGVYFAEAELVFMCKKMYSDDFKKEFIVEGYDGMPKPPPGFDRPGGRGPEGTPPGMPEGGAHHRPEGRELPPPGGPMKYHRFYIGEIVEVLGRE